MHPGMIRGIRQRAKQLSHSKTYPVDVNEPFPIDAYHDTYLLHSPFRCVWSSLLYSTNN